MKKIKILSVLLFIFIFTCGSFLTNQVKAGSASEAYKSCTDQKSKIECDSMILKHFINELYNSESIPEDEWIELLNIATKKAAVTAAEPVIYVPPTGPYYPLPCRKVCNDNPNSNACQSCCEQHPGRCGYPEDLNEIINEIY